MAKECIMHYRPATALFMAHEAIGDVLFRYRTNDTGCTTLEARLTGKKGRGD